MSVPKHRQTSSRVGRRRSHHAISAKQLGVCAACKAPTQPHHACPKCGNYAGRSVK
ncbi:50S ribosomal protein L32 [Candidatus Uhrbacteria bacterium]|nr:50S ribosomal protein L32 [Candidatus Uhrbacteria bacterium]